MSCTVWKEEIRRPGVHEIALPRGAEILCLREHRGRVCLWFRCDPAAPLEPRKIALVETGAQAPAADRYLGTVAIGALVLHAFERIAESKKR